MISTMHEIHFVNGRRSKKVVDMTQIMNLNHLAPDIQAEVLHLPLHYCGRELLKESELREIAAAVEWAEGDVDPA